jgi:hypothetical protein
MADLGQVEEVTRLVPPWLQVRRLSRVPVFKRESQPHLISNNVQNHRWWCEQLIVAQKITDATPFSRAASRSTSVLRSSWLASPLWWR